MALPASHPGIVVRFCKETGTNKSELFPDVDHIDVTVRPETLRARAEPVILQLPLVPCYASAMPPGAVAVRAPPPPITNRRDGRGTRLTIHKTQALSIKHVVRGCCQARRTRHRSEAPTRHTGKLLDEPEKGGGDDDGRLYGECGGHCLEVKSTILFCFSG